MRIFLLLPVISLLAVSNYPQVQLFSTFQTDTTTITHLLDGSIGEWPEEKFTTDKATKILYAVDNDKQMLFLAMNIPDKRVQQRIMQNGMSLFIDVKGKKKENRGVEFPLGMENVSDIGNMKVFGFDNAEPVSQSVKTEGTINIAMGWDSSYVLSIEYKIPLKMLEGSIAELNNKKISVGWKIHEGDGMEGNTNQPVTTTSRVVAVNSNGRPPSNRNVGLPANNNSISQPATNKAQPIWTIHTIIF